MKTLPFYSQDIFSLLLYIVNKKYLFILNVKIRNFNTRNNSNLNPPYTSMTNFKMEPIILE